MIRKSDIPPRSKIIAGKRYSFVGARSSKAKAQKLADKHRAEWGIPARVIPHSSRAVGVPKNYWVYARFPVGR